MTLNLRVELCFLLETCSVVLAGMAPNFCSGVSWFWNFASKLPTSSTPPFFFFLNNFQNFKILTKSGSFCKFYAFFTFDFLRQTRFSFLDRIPCGHNTNNTGITNGYQNSLCIQRCKQSGLTGYISVYFLLCLFFFFKKKFLSFTHGVLILMQLLFKRGVPFLRISAPKLFLSLTKVLLWFPVVLCYNLYSCQVQLHIQTSASAINLSYLLMYFN